MEYDSFENENAALNYSEQESYRDEYEGRHLLHIFDTSSKDDDFTMDSLLPQSNKDDNFGTDSLLPQELVTNDTDSYIGDDQTEDRSQAMSIDPEMMTYGEGNVKNKQPALPIPVSKPPEGLRSVFEIPERYRHIFAGYPCFNAIQSKVMDDILYSDKPVVIAAPTGSGKTVLFELAIVRFLQSIEERGYKGDFKIVYMAPVKALCSERCIDWSEKFAPLNLTCREVTGDSDTNDYFELREFRILLTTPEKWDSLTRKWRDHKSLVQVVKLFLIDEVHLLNEERRGPTMEAVVSRMKTVQHSLALEHTEQPHELPHGVRFVAVSATIPNIEDVAEWLSDSSELPAAAHKISENERPVPLKKVVLGYNCQDTWSPFRFDLSLTYKLKNVILSHAEEKPTLVFCSTRKGVQQTATVLVKDITFHLTPQQKHNIQQVAPEIKDAKIRENVFLGVACHHAGMDAGDRHITEQLFRSGMLPVLVATSTLAMGVNLPAHLVVIKSTEQYESGVYREYSESQLLQMMGRAGRPQFDTSATAVIMTKNTLKSKYERLVTGHQLVESSLHRHLPEHLNAEVVLHTIKHLDVAMDWVRSTFLYVRALRNPNKYGVGGPKTEECTRHKIETRLHELCMRELNALASCELLELNGMDVIPTAVGRLMARYYMALDSMKIFMQLTGEETLPEVLAAVSRCTEFTEVQLRVNERRALNTLNRCKNRETVRFPLPGRIKGRDMKVNVLSQASLGTLAMPDPALHQETVKVIRIGQRVTKCLSEFMSVKHPQQYLGNLQSTLLTKDFHCRMWHDSRLVTRQLDRIGPALAGQLAAAGKCSFDAIRDSNPRDLERILNRAPPLGNMLQSSVSGLPRYSLNLHAEEVRSRCVHVSLELHLDNKETLEVNNTAGDRHSSVVLLAERRSNLLVHRERISDVFLLSRGSYEYETEFKLPKCEEDGNKTIEVIAHVISETWVGLDVESLVQITPRDAKVQQQAMQTPRLAVAPRNLKAALQKFVRQHVKKAVLTSEGSTSVNETATLTPVLNKLVQSSTSEDVESHSSVVDQIRAKYGQLPALPFSRLGHQQVAIPTASAVTVISRPHPSASRTNHIATEADEVFAELPSACALTKSHGSPCFSDTASPIHILSQTPSPCFSPSYSPLSSPEVQQPVAKPNPRTSVITLPEITFDLGIEDLMADPPPPPVVREVKRLLPMDNTRSVLQKQRRLSPPRDANILQHLISSVLGTEVPPPVMIKSSDDYSDQGIRFTSPLMLLPDTDTNFRETHRRHSPQWSPELKMVERKTESLPTGNELEQMSPRSFLGAAFVNEAVSPIVWTSQEAPWSPRREEHKQWSCSTPAGPMPSRSWATPSPPTLLPPAPQWQPRTWNKRNVPTPRNQFL